MTATDATAKATPSLHATISGTVQGVYFRAWVCDQAVSLGLHGWVRNLADGQVEVLAQGAPEALDALKERLPQGSPLSRVDRVTANMIEYDKAFTAFTIRG
ncbi:acylphosphatase [Desulfovibrio sp. TomC]|uniref:acylphosphatase n=1 Tax=Desulfovibrio sp. TomC TaxID=1562888 RepID=UPI00057415C6|nr:acylphosphatase [Desulfovibrio sp. TomC]KHK00553.1 Acylphosphate phosphohydrolase [Desulfovibrio sp. TomC]